MSKVESLYGVRERSFYSLGNSDECSTNTKVAIPKDT